jgi:hypothetical protein
MKRFVMPIGVMLILANCTMANVGATAPERQTQRATFAANYDAVYAALIQQAGSMTWQVLYSDKDAGAIRVAYPQTMGAWGDTLAVNMTRADSGVVVEVRSTLGQGPNRRKVENYLSGTSTRLGLPAYVDPQRH